MDELIDIDPRAAYGLAKHPDRPVERQRPPGMSDETVAALGKLSEALEVVENARGFLYQFHRMAGTADLTLQEAVRMLREAGHPALAAEIEDVLVGRDVIEGRWTFQIVEDYDDRYWSVFRAMEHRARHVCGAAPPHIYEAEMKMSEQQLRPGTPQNHKSA